MIFSIESPFDLAGPQFLIFYVVLSTATILLLRLALRALERGGTPRFDDLDPYSLACLRGGPDEALRVCIIALVDRGMLKVDGQRLITVPAFVDAGQRALERALLHHFARGRLASGAYQDAPHEEALVIQRQLRELGLLPAWRHWLVRIALCAAGIFVLVAVSVTKIEIALGRGRHNILLLQVGTVLASAVLCYMLLAHLVLVPR